MLRVSIALSAVTGNPVRLYSIRAKRSPPGLRPQHVTAVKAVAQILDAEVSDLKVGSMEVSFSPKSPKSGRFLFDAGTAASTTLILQSLMPTMGFAPNNVYVEVRGGTNAPWAPVVEYLQGVLLPTIGKMGLKGSVSLLRRGFYPRGGGIVRASVEPVKNLKPLVSTEFGEVRRIRGLSYSSRLPPHIVERMAKSAEQTLRASGYGNFEIELECLQPEHPKCAIDPGCGVILFAELSSGAIIGSDSLGALGKPAEKVGKEAATRLLDQLKTEAPVDKYLGDQLIVYMALADGYSKIRVSELTLHTITCIHVSEKIVGATFEVVGEQGKPATIACNGIGLVNRFLT
jgi:RNA 3'-terminal phosphate cyclase (ATP)